MGAAEVDRFLGDLVHSGAVGKVEHGRPVESASGINTGVKPVGDSVGRIFTYFALRFQIGRAYENEKDA